GLAQLPLLEGNHDPVQVAYDEREENNGPNLSQDSCLAEIRDREPDVHRVPADPIRPPRHEPRGRASWNGRRGRSSESAPAPSGQAGPGCEDQGTANQDQLAREDFVARWPGAFERR